MPHLTLYIMPIGTVARGMPLQPQQRVTDLVQARLDGSQLLISYDDVDSAGFSAAAFINQPLQDADPLVLANSWGQSSVSSSSIYSTTVYRSMSDITTSNISDPLMHAALKRISLKKLQRSGYGHAVDFRYKNAPATLTVLHVTLVSGLQIPLVPVSSEVGTTPPYRRVMDICNVTSAAVVIGFAALLLAGLETGPRVLFLRGRERGWGRCARCGSW